LEFDYGGREAMGCLSMPPESEDMNMKRLCKECKRKGLPRGRSLISYAARKLGYCRGCYLEFYPERPAWDLPVTRMESERILNWSEIRLAERRGFDPTQWSDDFREEMEDYWDARRRDEL